MSGAGDPPAIDVRGVSFSFSPREGPRAVLDRVDFVVGGRDFVGIIGPNGGGKTTLVRIILGLLDPQEGSVRVLGAPPRAARRSVGYVPQRASINLAAPASVLDVVLMGRLGRSSWGWRFPRSDREAALASLALTGTAELAQRPLASLSGGQRQRVLIARALCADARLLILDEPTAGVDAEAERDLTELLHRLNERMPIVIVTHDIGFVASEVGSVLCLNRRGSVHRPQEVTGETLAAMYGGSVRMIGHDGCGGGHGVHVHAHGHADREPPGARGAAP
ncbi:MAG TPA: metal ABC transporter ATP-binding protein [Phycisphaerales bacterium]|nr:metal ABC transporter ATP-binding protein [Phycisphaerales bacterium]HMP35931.1 metal ABC transporter ATP-binding protein [Phycisphaerales bacterium]